MWNMVLEICRTIKLANEIWDTLKKKYGNEDVGTKKYVVHRWMKFK